MKTIKGDLILDKNMEFDEDLRVEGNIRREDEDGIRYNLKVKGNIDAWNIYARDIVAWDIYARDIDAMDIDALNIIAKDINARDIDAWNICSVNIDTMNIVARDIDAMDIDAGNIIAGNIVARNIAAWNIIFCQSIKLKDKSKGKIRAKAVIRDRFNLKQKEFESD